MSKKHSSKAAKPLAEMTPKELHRHQFFYVAGILWMFLSYFGVEVYASRYLDPVYHTGIFFGLFWALLLTSISVALPRAIGKVFYGLSFYLFAIFAAVQSGYYSIFGRMMWLGDIRYASEGGAFMGDVFGMFAGSWWFFTILLMVIGAVGCFLVPHGTRPKRLRGVCLLLAATAAGSLFAYPQTIFQQDANAWGLQSEYKRALSREGIYNTMYDAHKTYQVCGIYQTTVKDIWKHNIYPKTPMYTHQIEVRSQELDDWFAARPAHEPNELTGIFKDKNVVLVLMESMDDWTINETDTPTICRMMDEGMNFTNFYTPGYGSVRTFNTEFCVNTGIFTPTNGQYAFDYCNNDFSESLPNLLRARGYSAQSFHYNSPMFYNRGVMEPTMGYEAYNSFPDFGMEGEDLFADDSMYENEALMEKFYHGEEGQDYDHFLNFIISRNAHMTYTYDEEVSVWALEQYPQYRGISGNEEVDCMRAKARCLDDLFSGLLRSLAENGHLEDTVVVAFTDHYSYGMKDQSLVMQLSDVDRHLLVEKTPFFIWSADGPDLEVEKLGNTADILPTLVNLLGLEEGRNYLGYDLFDDAYEGSVFFQNHSWISNNGAYENGEVISTFTEQGPSPEEIDTMNEKAETFVRMSNLLLESDYYGRQNAE